jgi:PAS domain S-box-containing protein
VPSARTEADRLRPAKAKAKVKAKAKLKAPAVGSGAPQTKSGAQESSEAAGRRELLNAHIFQNPFVGITITDGDGICLMVNEAQKRITGIPQNAILGRDLRSVMDDRVLSVSGTLEVLRTKKEINLHQVSSYGRSYEVKALPVFGDDGGIAYVINYILDVTETEKFKNMLKRMEVERGGDGDQIQRLLSITQEVEGIVFCGIRMRDLINMAKKIAKSDATVLITGPSGTGKELIANLIHKNSERRGRPFIKLNCAAIPEPLLESELFGYEPGAFTGGNQKGSRGIFEAANGGSLLLDEIGEMPLQLQAKLLRVLQEQEVRRIGGDAATHVDVRIIAATNASLTDMLGERRFREDLYYRLNVIRIDVPGLADRKEDIPVLIAHYVRRFNQKYKVSKTMRREVVDFLAAGRYPGNIRELQNIVERLVLQSAGSEVTLNDAFEAYNSMQASAHSAPADAVSHAGVSLKSMMEEHEKRVLKEYMEIYKRPDEVARRLKIDRSTISRKLHKHGL